MSSSHRFGNYEIRQENGQPVIRPILGKPRQVSESVLLREILILAAEVKSLEGWKESVEGLAFRLPGETVRAEVTPGEELAEQAWELKR